MWLLLLFTMAWSMLPTTANARQCHGNPLCVCNNDLSKDVICDGVRFARIPYNLVDNFVTTTLVITHSNISEISDDFFYRSKLTALSIRDSHLSRIGVCAFCGTIESTLVTLDLSGNSLYEFPTRSLVKLQNLRWFSARDNRITKLDFDDDSEDIGWPLYFNLVTLFLSANYISQIPPGTFSKFKRLQTLELNNNGIATLEKGTFPSTLVSLHLNGNLLLSIPYDALDGLRSLQWLYLRDNRIARLPPSPPLPFKSLIDLDLGENLIRSISEPIGNGVKIHNLELDGNHLHKVEPNFFHYFDDVSLTLRGNILTQLDKAVFNQYKPRKLDLSFNSFKTVPVEALEVSGVKSLNMTRNALTSFDARLCSLSKLYLSQNLLTVIPNLPCSTTLKILDVSKNRIRMVAEGSLPFGHLQVLNLADNSISSVPVNVFSKLSNLLELNLAHNRLVKLPAEVIRPLKSLEVLNLMHNALEGYFNANQFLSLKRLDLRLNYKLKDEIPIGGNITHLDYSFTGIQIDHLLPVARRLSRFSYQLLPSDTLRSRFAQNFPDLLSIDLRYSSVSTIHTNAFYHLEALEEILMSHSRIETLSKRAFNRLPALQLLDMSHNRLKKLNLNWFCQMSDFNVVPSTLDLSYNYITALNAQDDHLEYECQNFITIMKLSHNRISTIDFKAFLTVKSTLLELDLSYNELDDQQLKKFIDLKKISKLNISYNRIPVLPRRAMSGLFHLQELDLRFNQIKQITPSALSSMPNLRFLDLSVNFINFIPQDAFNGTGIEVLRLDMNYLPALTSSAFRAISASLTSLSLSYNGDMHALTTGEFSYLTELLHLDISNCGIKSVTPGAFRGLGLLISLNIANNWLSYLEAETLQLLPLLQHLDLRNCSLKTMPSLRVPELRTLSLSANKLDILRDEVLTTARKIQRLDLSLNRFSEIPQKLWKSLPELRTLNLAYNPVQALKEQSFADLPLLEELDITGLSSLKDFDIRALANNIRLRKLATSTYTGVGAFRLEAVLSKMPSLHELHVFVEVNALSYQIQWGFGHKLRVLKLRGPLWEQMASDALQGLEGLELTNKKELHVSITETALRELNIGIIRKLAQQPRRINLDLRGNQIKQFFAENKDDALNITEIFPRATLELRSRHHRTMLRSERINGPPVWVWSLITAALILLLTEQNYSKH
ncbi:chaoptin-like isoform X2 [Varroa destructor]|uniref:Chaoptin n=1 Tax=Varroa destructor TaxID=109461 RepID=A0A7M7JNR1_VARDE|nr:chaoptin-like isoform X2 [Varroa destructor]